MKALVGAFYQEKALVGAFSVIVQPVVEPMEHYTALCQVRGQVTGAAPDLLPHSFALLGHSAQVMPPTFSVASNMAPPSLPFTNE